MRVLVARPVAARGPVVRPEMPVLAEQAEPVAPAVPAATVLRVSTLWVRRGSPAVRVVPVVRAVPPGLAGFVAMVARAVRAELVAGVGTQARTRVPRDLPAGPAAPEEMRVPVVRQAPVRVPVVRLAVRVWAETAEPAARAVPVPMPRLGPRAMREVLVERVVRVVLPELAACGAVAASVAMAVRVAGVVRPG